MKPKPIKTQSKLIMTALFKEKSGIKAGVALNPGTPIEVLDNIIDIIDLVLVMTVNHGFGGLSFMLSQLAKISKIPHFRRKCPFLGKNTPFWAKMPFLGKSLENTPFWAKISKIHHFGRKSREYPILEIGRAHV